MNAYVTGGLITLIIGFILRLIRWENRRQTAKIEAIVLGAKETRAKICLNSEFICQVRHATNADELLELESEIRLRGDELFGDDFVNLLERVKARLQDFESN